jgi:hypothetical protein
LGEESSLKETIKCTIIYTQNDADVTIDLSVPLYIAKNYRYEEDVWLIRYKDSNNKICSKYLPLNSNSIKNYRVEPQLYSAAGKKITPSITQYMIKESGKIVHTIALSTDTAYLMIVEQKPGNAVGGYKIFPIAKANSNVYYYSGPDAINYNLLGLEPVYNIKNFEIYDNKKSQIQNDVTWSL